MVKRGVVLFLLLAACSSESAGGGVEPTSTTVQSEQGSSEAPSPTARARPQEQTAPLQGITLRRVVGGLSSPIGMTNAGDGSGRAFVIEQGGAIRIVRNGRLFSRPFLDISSLVSTGGEQGLLGLAFHPRFETNRRFYVNYTDTAGDTVIAEYKRATGDPHRAATSSRRVLLTFDQPFSNHNGGHLAFGPDGYLYIATGDGGGAGDPQGNGQRRDTLLGKILRIDVDARSGGRAYGIPEDNPFRSEPGARPEIWSYGLRNPWRFSFDRRTDAMWIGDVGQGSWEEIDREPASSAGGINWGWNIKEGTHCFVTQTECEAAQTTGDLRDPIAEYSHDFGCSVTGGHVYRGRRFPSMRGYYFFADYCTGLMWTLEAGAGAGQEERLRLRSDRRIASFGESGTGELFVVDRAGELLRVVPSN